MEETPIDSEPTLLTPYNIPSDTSSRSSESNLLDEDNSGKDTDTVISGYIYIYIPVYCSVLRNLYSRLIVCGPLEWKELNRNIQIRYRNRIILYY